MGDGPAASWPSIWPGLEGLAVGGWAGEAGLTGSGYGWAGEAGLAGSRYGWASEAGLAGSRCGRGKRDSQALAMGG